MKLLSFLGTRPLKETTYVYRDKRIRTSIVQEALSSFFPIDTVVLFTTVDAFKKTYPDVALRIPGCEAVRIPSGRTEEELWDIFSIVAGKVDPDDDIVFDITHGFRSLPFIAFLSSAYIREVRRARIRAIVYGAFDAEVESETPVFDLTPFIHILDWLGAVRSFMVHGDAGEIQKIVSEETKRVFQDPGKSDKPDRMKGFSKQLESFSLAARLAQPIEALDIAQKVIDSLPAAKEEISRFAPPLAYVLDQVEGISKFSAREPAGKTGIDRAHLRAQRQLISYQVEKGLYMQAVALAREWIVSLLIFAAGDPRFWLEGNCRNVAGETLTGGSRKRRGEQYDRSAYSDWFESLDCFEDVVRTWDMVIQVRNDIAHCGMKLQRQKARAYRQKIEDIPPRLEELERLLCP